MMKENWEMPRAIVEVFQPNEYIGLCYDFLCQTPNNNAHYNYIYKESDGQAGWSTDDTLLHKRILTKSSSGGTTEFNNTYFWGDNTWECQGTTNYPTANGYVLKQIADSTEDTPDTLSAVSIFYWGNGAESNLSDLHLTIVDNDHIKRCTHGNRS